MEEMLNNLRKHWAKNITDLPTFIDLGRLCKRIDVYYDDEADFVCSAIKTSDHKKEPLSMTTVSSSGSDADEHFDNNPMNISSKCHRNVYGTADSRAEDLARVFEIITNRLELDEVRIAVSTALSKFISDAGDNLDYRTYIQELFTNLPEESPSVKLFKVVNQSALFLAITHMKLSLMSAKTSLKNSEALQTKDIRSSDGWRVKIKISNTGISVSHVRKEQSLGEPFVADYWDVKWRFTIEFSPGMSQLLSCNIEVLNMTFGKKIPASMKKEIQRVYYETINNDLTYSQESDPPTPSCLKCVIM